MRRPCLLLLASLPALTGCRSVAGYFSNRALDLTDIVDLKYGAGLKCQGLGAKAQLIAFLGLGLGCSTDPGGIEWYGRRAVQREMSYLHLAIFGVEPPFGPCGPGNYGCINLLFFRAQEFPPERMKSQIWRAGGEIQVPFLMLGLHLNLFELVDFFAGWFGADIAEDDGLAKGVDAFPEEEPAKPECSEPEKKN